ncbi:hypothetical protein GPN2_13242 [Streptomyces murinus]
MLHPVQGKAARGERGPERDIERAGAQGFGEFGLGGGARAGAAGRAEGRITGARGAMTIGSTCCHRGSSLSRPP